jgi:hypothetical protein
MKYLTVPVGLFVCSWLAASGDAQQPASDESPRQQVVSTFDRQAPKVGDPVGELQLVDADGREVDPAKFRGGHTVLVFGCLT